MDQIHRTKLVYLQKIGELDLKNNNPLKLIRFQSDQFNPQVKRANPRR